MQCPKDGVEMKLIPEGISKRTGKPYKAFYSCSACKNTLQAEQTSTDAQSPQGTQVNANNPNVERILEAIKAAKAEILDAVAKLG